MIRPSDNLESELFALQRQGVDLALAVQCVELSKLAYSPIDTGRKKAAQLGYREFDAITQRNGRDYVFVVSDANRHFVAFRGSDDFRDWLTNLSLWSVTTEHGPVHRGYYEVCRNFKSDLAALLEKLPKKPVVLTGHSMGGAVALLVAMSFLEGPVELDSLYTFGQPKTGGKNFNKSVEENLQAPYFRFVHGADAFATWGYGSRSSRRRSLGTPCYFDIRGRLGFGGQLMQMPRLNLRFHRLDHYRYFLKLNQLRFKALDENEDVTIIQD